MQKVKEIQKVDFILFIHSVSTSQLCCWLNEMHSKNILSVAKYILIITGIAIIIYGFAKDADLTGFIGVAIVAGVFFLNNILSVM